MIMDGWEADLGHAKVVDCILETMRQVAEQAKAGPVAVCELLALVIDHDPAKLVAIEGYGFAFGS